MVCRQRAFLPKPAPGAERKGAGNEKAVLQGGRRRRHRHGRAAVRHPAGTSPLVQTDRSGGLQPQCGQDLCGGGGQPLGHAHPHARKRPGYGGAGRRPGGADRRPGGLYLLCCEHAQKRDQSPGRSLCQGRVPGGLQQQRQPRHPRRAHGGARDQRRPHRDHPGPAPAPGHPAGLHRRQVQLQPAELRPRLPPPDEGFQGHQGPGLHLSGHFGRGQNL